MNQSAIRHLSYLPFMQAHARDCASFRLFAASGDLSSVSLRYFKRSEPENIKTAQLQVICDDGVQCEWACRVQFPEEMHYIKYSFILQSAGETLFFDENGFHAQQPTDGFFELLQIQDSEVRTVPEWTRGCIYYQIFPERFKRMLPARREYEAWNSEPTRENFLGGDLAGIRSKLPYLKELGVECIYMTPIFSADFNHKYATTNYFSIDPDFGTEQDLIDLVHDAHALGMRIVLDGVFNHVGTHFAPFEDVVQNGSSSRYADWFYIKKEPIEIDPACYECVGDYPYMPRLRVANPETNAYILKVLRYWLEKANIDGWRFDVADELDIHCVHQWRRSIKRDFPNALMLGETWRDAAPMVLAGDAFDSAMNYLFRDAVLAYFARKSITETEFARRIERIRMRYPHDVLLGMYNPLGSHDTARFMTECAGDMRSMELAVFFQLCFPGAPAIYYGDELGMQGENDPGCRAGMCWDREKDNPMLDAYKRAIKLRHAHEALRTGSYKLLICDDTRHLLGFERESETERVRILFNRGDAPQALDDAEWGGHVDIRPYSVHIVTKNKEGLSR